MESQENREFKLKQPMEAYPTLAELKAHPATGRARIEMYNTSSNAQAPVVTDLDRINIFWILRPKPITYYAFGMKMRQDKQEYIYVKMSNEPGVLDINWTGKNADKKYWVRFDPTDKSMIYCYEKTATGDLRLAEVPEEKILTNRVIGKSETLQRFYEQINEIHAKVQARPKGERYVDNKEADIISKLTATIEKLEAENPPHKIIEVLMDAMGRTMKNRGGKNGMLFLKMCDDYVQNHIAPKVDKEP